MAMTRPKGYQAKKRNSGDRNRRSLLLIAAEGKNKTETQYFRDFAKAHRQNIKIASGNDTDPVHIASSLAKEYQTIELEPELGDRAYCLVDADVDPRKNEQLAKADDICRKEGLELIVSSPCFEVWGLCHFESNSRHYTSSDAATEMLEKRLPGFKKSGVGLYDALSPDTDKAIKNAKTMEKACLDAGYTPHTVEFSPSTEVYKVAESILQNESKQKESKEK